jgi:putative thioredoxin
MNTENPHIVATAAATFERDVIERSKEVPVVVDFWADWCQPCRLLAPVLEGLAEEYGGRFVLVKADAEAMPDVASAFGVRSIPAVYGLRNGEVVDGFVGVLSESSIREFLNRLLPNPAESLADEARRLEESDPEAAAGKYREALALEPDNPPAAIGLARLALTAGRLDECGTLLDGLERRGYLEPEAEQLKGELILRRGMAGTGGDLEAARAAHAARPDDLRAALRMAEALAGAGQYAEALGLALGLVERDRRGLGEEARKLMLAIFQVLPADSELSTDYRRRLSIAL